MLKVINQNNRQLILEDKRPIAGGIALIFVLISLFGLINLLIQVIRVFDTYIRADNGLLWFITVSIFVTLAFGFVLLGISAALHFLIGSTCMIDKDAETITLQQVNLFRTTSRQYSIYSVSYIDIKQNDEVHAFGVFFVLRDGSQVPLASYHQQDEEVMLDTVQRLRTFLR